jgi:large subunit ribosomal protein L2
LFIYLRIYKAVTPSLRFKKTLDKRFLSNSKFRNISRKLLKSSGRNSSGKITVRHHGAGLQNFLFNIDFKRRSTKRLAFCTSLNYTKYRTCLFALIKYSNGIFSYILAPQGFRPGVFTRTCQYHRLYYNGYKVGYSVFLRYISINSIIFNIELEPKKGGKYIRAAGTYGLIVRTSPDKKLVFVKLPTTKLAILTEYCLVSLGKCSNKFHYKVVVGKAGLNRIKGVRPTVRGVAMNPVDHPHGGRTKTNSPEVTPWGKIAKFNK